MRKELSLMAPKQARKEMRNTVIPKTLSSNTIDRICKPSTMTTTGVLMKVLLRKSK